MTTKELEGLLYEFSTQPMSAVQIHGFYTGLLSAPGDPEPMAWIEEILRADGEMKAPQGVFKSEKNVKRLLHAIIDSYNPVADSISENKVELPFRSKDPGQDDRYQASRWAEAFWRGFVLAGGDMYVRDDEQVRQALIIPLVIRDPEDALSEIEFDEEPSTTEIADFVAQQMQQLPKVIRFLVSRAHARHLQDLQARQDDDEDE